MGHDDYAQQPEAQINHAGSGMGFIGGSK
jgi:hypothetical protein